MAINIKGINTGVIRKGSEFLALALKIKQQKDTEILLFFPTLVLKDLLLALEQPLYKRSQLAEDVRLKQQKTQDITTQKMHENIPVIHEDELKNADINQRVDSLVLSGNTADNLTLSLTLFSGEIVNLVVNKDQIELCVTAIIHALNNANMQELALRISSLLDFLPLYDIDCQDNGNLEYDTYDQPAWKQNLFNYTLALIYRYTDDAGKEQQSGAVIKSRNSSETKEVEAISHRVLNFSPRLSKLRNKPCQISVRTIASGKQQITRDMCMRALHHLRQGTQQQKRP